jgi:uncharacterized protein
MPADPSDDRPLPPRAAWRHDGAGNGFEVTYFHPLPGGGVRLVGHTASVEDGEPYAVRYEIDVDDRWCTRRAQGWAWTDAGHHEVTVESDGAGHWVVDGEARPELDGCHDVDFESSACTNTFPVHRLALAVGEAAEAPAAYVRWLDLRAERLEQRYRRAPDEGDHALYDYESPRFDYADRLTYDGHGLILDYPGIARRAL